MSKESTVKRIVVPDSIKSGMAFAKSGNILITMIDLGKGAEVTSKRGRTNIIFASHGAGSYGLPVKTGDGKTLEHNGKQLLIKTSVYSHKSDYTPAVESDDYEVLDIS